MPKRAARLLAPLLAAALALAPAAAPAQSGAETPRPVVIRDAETETLLRTFAAPLFRAAGLNDSSVRIILLSDPAINSFVTPGNRLYIHSGLLQKADSAREVVGVLAHETGHMAAGHVYRLPEQQREALLTALVAALAGVAGAVAGAGGGAAMAGVLGGQHLAMANYTAFSRMQEEAADQAGLSFLDRLGWSGEGLLDLFRKVEGEEALSADLQDPYMRTHPLTQERMEFVEAHEAKSPYRDRPLPAGFEDGFRMVRAKLDGFLDPPAATLRRYPEGDASAPARYARAIALFRSGHIAPAAALVDGLIRERPGVPWLSELKCQILFEGGRGAEALAPCREAARLAPDQPQIRLALARAMIESGDPALLRPAVAELQSALARERDDGFAWRQLGIAWGRLGEMGQANLALAEEALLEGDIPRARRLGRAAEAALPPGPAKLRAQDIGNAVSRENRKYNEDRP